MSDSRPSLIVIATDGTRHTFDGRGVAPLYNLYMRAPEILRGASVIDKVIGKGAAAIMVASGIARFTTPVASRAAMRVFSQAGIPGHAQLVVPHIIRRDGKGMCPLEQLLQGIDNIGHMLPIITNFVRTLTS